MNKLLLNDGGYAGFENVKFPVEVDVQYNEVFDWYHISTDELKRITGFAHECKLIFIPRTEIA